MKLLSFCLLLCSIDALADCNVLTEPGGWSAEGLPGVVELDFDKNGSVSIHILGPEPIKLQDAQGHWVCKDSEIIISFNGQKITATINKNQENDSWSLDLENNNVPYLSQRKLTPFGY